VHHYSFQPFSGSIESFPPAELIGLTGVSEGWYIDYKAEASSSKDLGRHLTAFANQHGGWLLIGIVENSATMTAGSFPGIPNSQIPETLTKLRDASAHNSHPPLYFEHRIISGPVAELDLPKNRSLVMVGVPESQDTPHVHSSGKIYRRQASVRSKGRDRPACTGSSVGAQKSSSICAIKIPVLGAGAQPSRRWPAAAIRLFASYSPSSTHRHATSSISVWLGNGGTTGVSFQHKFQQCLSDY
jgi:schlafen family protein